MLLICRSVSVHPESRWHNVVLLKLAICNREIEREKRLRLAAVRRGSVPSQSDARAGERRRRDAEFAVAKARKLISKHFCVQGGRRLRSFKNIYP